MKFNVFLNHPNPTGSTPDTDPHFVGTYAMFGLKDHQAAHGNVNVQVPLTRTIAQLRQANLLTGGPLKVQLVPVAVRGVSNARGGGSNVELSVGRINILTR
jgi:Protein of unknown function (DUF_B2219)